MVKRPSPLPDFSKTHYVITWTIDEWADSPREAAQMAKDDMKEFGATVFEVREYGDDKVIIDLEETNNVAAR